MSLPGQSHPYWEAERRGPLTFWGTVGVVRPCKWGVQVAGPPDTGSRGTIQQGARRLCFFSLSTFAQGFFIPVLISQIRCQIQAVLLCGVLVEVSLLMTETTLAERDMSQGVGKLREHQGEPGTWPGTPHPHRTAHQQPCLSTPEEAPLCLGPAP